MASKSYSFLVSVVHQKRLYEIAMKTPIYRYCEDGKYTLDVEDKNVFQPLIPDSEVREFGEIVAVGETIRAGTGVRLKKLTAFAQTVGLGGLEWMEGIPGTRRSFPRGSSASRSTQMMEID